MNLGNHDCILIVSSVVAMIGVEIIHIVCVVCVKEQQLASKTNEDKNLAFKHINSQEEKSALS